LEFASLIERIDARRIRSEGSPPRASSIGLVRVASVQASIRGHRGILVRWRIFYARAVTQQ
jgi:hypothetical protein